MITKYKFFILLASLLLLGFFISSFLSYKMTKELTTHSLRESSLPLSSDNVYSEIQRDLLKPNLVSSLMANDTFLINWILDGEQNLKQITSYLEVIKRKYNTSSSFFVSNKTMNYYYEKGILKNISAAKESDSWFYRVKILVSEYESNIDKDFANKNTLTIFSNYKVKDKNGKFLGITGVGLQTSQVSSLLDTYKEKYKHEIYFVNFKKKIILKSKTFKKDKSFHKLISKKIDEFNKNDKSILEYTYLNEKYYLNIRFIDELSLYLCIEAKEKDFTKEIEENFFKNILFFIIVIIFIMLIIIIYINKYQKHLEVLAKKDKLTKLSNRHEFEESFKNILSSNRKKENKVTLILFDIDNFKDVNDTYGHLTGDKVLVIVARVFKNTLRSTDLVSRWGGEEFIAVLSNINKSNSFEVAEKLRLEIYNNKEIQDLIKRPLSISIGLVTKEKDENENELFLRVDKNLFIAKQEGRNRTIM